MKAVIAFDAKSPHYLAPLLKRGYWHVWCALFHEPSNLWIVHDSTRVGIEIYPQTHDMLAEKLSTSTEVFTLETDPAAALKLPAMVNTCVGHTKITLGLRSFALTPHQLRQHLHELTSPERTSTMSRITDWFRTLDLRLPGAGEGGGGGGGGTVGGPSGGGRGDVSAGGANVSGFSASPGGGGTYGGGFTGGDGPGAADSTYGTGTVTAVGVDVGTGQQVTGPGAVQAVQEVMGARDAAPTAPPAAPPAAPPVATPVSRPAIGRPVTGNAGRRPVRGGGPSNVRNIGGAAGISMDNLSRALKALTGQ